MKFFMALFIILQFCLTSYSQQPFFSSSASTRSIADSTSIDNTFYKLPRFDIHIGAALVNGGRIGIRAQILRNFSIEFFYGYDLANFVGASDEEKRYGFGINWHKQNSNFVISFLAVRSQYIYAPLKDNYYISPTIGYLTFKDNGLQTFIRIGPAIRFSKNTGDNSLSVKFNPNIDVGISFVIN